MISLLENIWEFFKSIIAFVVHMIDFMIDQVTFIPEAILTLFEAVAYLPGVLIGFASLYITFLIFNYLLGRK